MENFSETVQETADNTKIRLEALTISAMHQLNEASTLRSKELAIYFSEYARDQEYSVPEFIAAVFLMATTSFDTVLENVKKMGVIQ